MTSLRLSEAKRLLLTSDTNVQEVAYTVGYTNLNQFYKVFQRYASMSPADYRRYYTRAGYTRAGGAEVVLRHDRRVVRRRPARVA